MKNEREREFFKTWRAHRYLIHKEIGFSSMKKVMEEFEFFSDPCSEMLEEVMYKMSDSWWERK